MKKAEVTAATTEDLIVELIRMVAASRMLKSDQRAAKWICEELESRKVIDDSASLHEQWSFLYI